MSEQRRLMDVNGKVVTAMGFGTSVGIIGVYAARAALGLEIPAEVAVAGANAITFVVQRLMSAFAK